ncbi:hypothetical protein B0T26DRAFT_805835 [Lasiosphaeria miniovina]|uniref:Aminoglycoside phosphotransferase domain-containing protein n=1 Tax=Lasiosphaeria miniovina TaxID=1954250 RepID=A0AA39ZYQ1_9PEZI|nr:uncharacterized protein B0T26DRAFT_805835 [Lasiosphaeria miniovina]KAK0705894.1 hypothetical protein B0T26DRAFT_805835 [Lasiosphaeria miniovina]
MEYVRKHTAIPVPQVVAYASSASNELGYEWILMEKMPGVSGSEFWDETMPFDAKKRLAIDIAGYMKTLLQLRFLLLGNPYFSDIWLQVNYTPVTWQEHDPDCKLSDPDDNLGLDPAFVAGRMVSPSFYSGKRFFLQAHRGSYGTARDPIVAKIDLLGQRIHRLTPKPGTEYYCNTDESLAEGGPEALEAFDELRQVAPRIFSDAEGPEDAKVLRGIYAKALGDALFDNSLHSKDEVNLKKKVRHLVEIFEDRWESVTSWLNNEIDREKYGLSAAEDSGEESDEEAIEGSEDDDMNEGGETSQEPQGVVMRVILRLKRMALGRLSVLGLY